MKTDAERLAQIRTVVGALVTIDGYFEGEPMYSIEDHLYFEGGFISDLLEALNGK